MTNRFFTFLKLHRYSILLLVISLGLYLDFAFRLHRTDFVKLLALFAALFFLQIKLIQFEKWNFKFLFLAGVVFRLAFLWVEPNLSQDFYRFIWDGELIKSGINPYIHLPNDLIQQTNLPIANAQELYQGMGALSAKHYSNYPPVNQILFTLSSILGGGSVFGSLLVMRLFIIAAAIGTLHFGRKLLLLLGSPDHLIFWYYLNPLVIIELTGNLHFEGVMLFFFVWALYLIFSQKWKWGAPVYALSILLKLVPLLFLPMFLKHLGFKKTVLFYVIVGLSCLALLIPFYSPVFVENYAQTVGLWFSNFEFNAGVYNIVKYVGVHFFDAKPWILVKSYGSLVPKLVIVAALLLTFFRKNEKPSVLLASMLFLLTFYYLLSSTVHPWYLVFLLILGILADFRYPVVWSAVVILSYFAYSNPEYEEHLGLLALEYSIVFGYIGYEFLKNSNNKPLFRKKMKQH